MHFCRFSCILAKIKLFSAKKQTSEVPHEIAELFGQGRPVFSCEIFPPKKGSPIDSIYQTLDGLRDIRPDFISVTYGACGSGAVNRSTQAIACMIEQEYHISAMAHLTCVGCTKESSLEIMDTLKEGGVENILALRGDHNPDVPSHTDFLHASDLTAWIKQH